MEYREVTCRHLCEQVTNPFWNHSAENNIEQLNKLTGKINPNNAQAYIDSWAFMNNETSIQFKGTVWNIIQLNKLTFLLTAVVLLGTGETITFSKL